jgi:hypothetical protein
MEAGPATQAADVLYVRPRVVMDQNRSAKSTSGSAQTVVIRSIQPAAVAVAAGEVVVAVAAVNAAAIRLKIQPAFLMMKRW